jgi:Gpi18-like mannosyltransferase
LHELPCDLPPVSTVVPLGLRSAGYQQFCASSSWKNAAMARPYCLQGGPSLYSYIQSQYWGVGLFKYYQLQQVTCTSVICHNNVDSDSGHTHA